MRVKLRYRGVLEPGSWSSIQQICPSACDESSRTITGYNALSVFVKLIRLRPCILRRLLLLLLLLLLHIHRDCIFRRLVRLSGVLIHVRSSFWGCCHVLLVSCCLWGRHSPVRLRLAHNTRGPRRLLWSLCILHRLSRLRSRLWRRICRPRFLDVRLSRHSSRCFLVRVPHRGLL